MRTFPRLLCLVLLTLLTLLGMLTGCISYPLEEAATRGDVQTVRTLLDQGHKEGMTDAFIQAACKGRIEVVQLLLERGVGVNDVHMYTFAGQGISALQCAASNGHPEMVSLLLKAGANREFTGWAINATALELAKKNGHTSVVKLLEEEGSTLATSPQRPARSPSTKESSPPPIY